MLADLSRVIEQVSKDKGIPKEILVEAIEAAMLTAAKKKLGLEREIEAHFNLDMGEVELFQFRTVVETIEDEDLEITQADAHKLDPEAQLGDSIGEKIDASQFGRIAAQTAKQVIIQKVRDAEQDIIYTEFKDRVGELITGIVRRIEKGNIIVDLGRTEAISPYREQVPSETYKPGERFQGYCVNVEAESKGPQVVLSRRNSGLLIKLFEVEVPEIAEGIVEIKAAAREPGGRSKIAVYSKDSDVDPVGACVGMKGSRVQSVVQELRGEKIDIVSWNIDPAQFVCNAIAPADVSKVIINEKTHTMEVVVADDQLSLAIGKRGQNVRLASELAGWNIDIYSEEKLEQMAKWAKKLMVLAMDIESSMATILYSQAFRTPQEIAEAPIEQLERIPGISKERIVEISEKAKAYIKKKEEAAEKGLDLDAQFMEQIKQEEAEENKVHEPAVKNDEEGAEAEAPAILGPSEAADGSMVSSAQEEKVGGQLETAHDVGDDDTIRSQEAESETKEA
jgi:transcription termination/antitermination protein NusA